MTDTTLPGYAGYVLCYRGLLRDGKDNNMMVPYRLP